MDRYSPEPLKNMAIGRHFLSVEPRIDSWCLISLSFTLAFSKIQSTQCFYKQSFHRQRYWQFYLKQIGLAEVADIWYSLAAEYTIVTTQGYPKSNLLDVLTLKSLSKISVGNGPLTAGALFILVRAVSPFRRAYVMEARWFPILEKNLQI